MPKPKAAPQPKEPGYYWIKTYRKGYNPIKGQMTWDSGHTNDWELIGLSPQSREPVSRMGCELGFGWGSDGEVITHVVGPLPIPNT